MRRPRAWANLAALVALAFLATAASAAPIRPLQFTVFSRTGIGLTDIVWTGRQFLLVRNTVTTVTTMDTTGRVGATFATLPTLVEETRCVASPGAHGFPAGEIYCHTPDTTIYRISADGTRISVFARLNDPKRSDGALSFDTVGRFGYGLVAATGLSGRNKPPGGNVYVVNARGRVRRIGSYRGPGGADQIAIAPRRFGSASGQALITVCPGPGRGGKLVAIDARGRARTLVRFDDGPNPIAPLVQRGPKRGAARAGLYVTDTGSTNVFFLPAAQLRPYAGTVLVGSEVQGRFWFVVPTAEGFRTIRVRTSLDGGSYNLEGAKYVL